MILAPIQKLPNNVGNLGKIIVATGFELLPKVQKIAQSGHTAQYPPLHTPTGYSEHTGVSLPQVTSHFLLG